MGVIASSTPADPPWMKPCAVGCPVGEAGTHLPAARAAERWTPAFVPQPRPIAPMFRDTTLSPGRRSRLSIVTNRLVSRQRIEIASPPAELAGRGDGGLS